MINSLDRREILPSKDNFIENKALYLHIPKTGGTTIRKLKKGKDHGVHYPLTFFEKNNLVKDLLEKHNFEKIKNTSKLNFLNNNNNHCYKKSVKKVNYGDAEIYDG